MLDNGNGCRGCRFAYRPLRLIELHRWISQCGRIFCRTGTPAWWDRQRAAVRPWYYFLGMTKDADSIHYSVLRESQRR